MGHAALENHPLLAEVRSSAPDLGGARTTAADVVAGDLITSSDDDDARWISCAIELATANVANGGGPFGAVIVAGGRLVSRGQNRVTAILDPTAHAEVEAIRAACRALGDFSLAGATLYTSCEPCPMCQAAALWARVDRVVFAADRHDAARGGFDDREFYELVTRDRSTWPVAIHAVRPANSTEPFDAWLANGARTEY